MDTEGWENFFVIAGGASAALTGLVFVAVSLNVDRILVSPGLRKIAAQTLVLLIMPLIMSLILITPMDQRWIAGLSCVVGGFFLGLTLVVVGHGMDLSQESSAIRRLRHLTPTLSVCVLIVIAGVSILLDFGGGLYWLVPAVILALLGGVANAWLFVIRIENWKPGTTDQIAGPEATPGVIQSDS